MALVPNYRYKDVDYTSEWAVRKAIAEIGRVLFSEEPREERKEFWAKLGVEYSEIEYVPPEIPFDENKPRKLQELERAFLMWRQKDATLISSLGFRIDADERAMIDVNGLVTLAQPAMFMDARNEPHQLTVEQLKTIQKEIIESGNKAYEAKWKIRTQIESATNNEELNKIDVVFTEVDFYGQPLEEDKVISPEKKE